MYTYLHDKTGLKTSQLKAVIQLLDNGCTIPFIARYRKEQTGSLDEIVLDSLQQELKKYRDLVERQTFICNTISAQGQLTPQLAEKITSCFDPLLLEDLYLPYKVKRKNRADKARELGLEPLAILLLQQTYAQLDQLVKPYLTKDINAENALAGARDILAERISEDPPTRVLLRNIFNKHALLHAQVVKGHQVSGQKYRDYYQYSEKTSSLPAHRILALFRGEEEGHLKVDIGPDPDRTIQQLKSNWVKNRSASAYQVSLAVEDSYKRLLQPSLATETHSQLKEQADLEAILVFAQNVQNLLLSAPLGEKPIMGIDPGFRTGCKVVLLGEQGNLLHHDTIFPHPPHHHAIESLQKIKLWLSQFHVSAIAIGNGTAGRETFDWLHTSLPDWTAKIYLISEAGASVYSASELAREEFPDLDLTFRGAISIGRRLQDPLAELIKIDPKSIGVGQYQHDVNQKKLREKLERIVESCVNQVGVQINTASKSLLRHVSGLGPVIAENIVRYRTQFGPFTSRRQLLRVPKLGVKAFEQCAGFLRLRGGENPLDNTGVHPERYPLVQRMANDLDTSIPNLIADDTLRRRLDLSAYLSPKVGLPTLHDILNELEKPGLDPRGQAEAPAYTSGIRSIDDLIPGMILAGMVTNLTQFGAFVDIGVKQDGLVHISEITHRFIQRPEEVLSLQQKVNVKVLDIEPARKRISLSIKQAKV